jgi:hypothetical protein
VFRRFVFIVDLSLCRGTWQAVAIALTVIAVWCCPSSFTGDRNGIPVNLLIHRVVTDDAESAAVLHGAFLIDQTEVVTMHSGLSCSERLIDTFLGVQVAVCTWRPKLMKPRICCWANQSVDLCFKMRLDWAK